MSAPAIPNPAPLPSERHLPETVLDRQKAVRDSVLMSIGGQVERLIGTFTALSLRWGLDPAALGIYSGLRIYLDNTNRSSLGIGVSAVQEIPILRAAGRFEEARHLANVAHTTNLLTCSIFSASIFGMASWKAWNAEPSTLDSQWAWGLAAVGWLALIKRRETFLVAVLRAEQQFALNAELDVLEAVVSAIFIPLGLWFAGLWGLLAAVGLLLLSKIAYAQARSPIRFAWAWDFPMAWRLMKTGLPILANSAVFGFALTLDRMLILWREPQGEFLAGLYTIAIMGTSWSLDLAGRIVLVLYNTFQTTYGKTDDRAQVVRQSILANEAQAWVLFSGGAIAYLAAPALLGLLMPDYQGGVVAIRPLLAGSVLLALAWPARQVLITLGQPYRLFLGTLAGLAITAVAGGIGLELGGLFGLGWGMSLGYSAIFLLTTAVAIVGELGYRPWLTHLLRLSATGGLFAIPTLLISHLPIGFGGLPFRLCLLMAWLVPVMLRWLSRHHWGGVPVQRWIQPLGLLTKRQAKVS